MCVAANAKHFLGPSNKWEPRPADDEYLFRAGIQAIASPSLGQDHGRECMGPAVLQYRFFGETPQFLRYMGHYITGSLKKTARIDSSLLSLRQRESDATFWQPQRTQYPFRSGIDTVRIGGQNRGAASTGLEWGDQMRVRMYNQAADPQPPDYRAI